MKPFLLSLALVAFTGTATATNYYVSDCGSGATAQCVRGNDLNAGTSPASPWLSCAKVALKFSALAAGDNVLFARGSAQDACQLNYLWNAKSRKATPITVGAYDAPWATTVFANPILSGTAGNYTFSLRNLGNAEHDEGYVVQDLHFKGPGVASAMFAILLGNDVKHVTLQRLEIEEFRGGIQCSGGTNQPLNLGSDGLSDHITIRNSSIHNNRGMGLLIDCSDTLIENNKLDSNGVGMLDHHIYIDDAELNNVALTTSQIVIRGNTLTNNSPYSSETASTPTPGGCRSVAIVVHGLKKGVFIEYNTVSEPTVPLNGPCWGISVDSGGYTGIYATEGFNNVVIRGNSLINFDMGIGVDLCERCTVENNYVYSERSGATGIVAPSKYFSAATAGNTLNNNLTVRNNSIYLKNPTYASVGIRLSRDGASHTVVSNLIYFGSGTTTASACFNTAGLAPSAFAAFDYNLCRFSANPGAWDSARTTLSAQQAVKLDLHSMTVDPSLIPPTAPAFALTVPAGSAVVKAGHPTLSSKKAFGGVERGTAVPSIGAYEVGANSVVPSSPTSIGMQ